MRRLETAATLLGLLLALSCSSKSSNSSPQCRLDSDCAAGSICQAKKCTPGCRASRDCPTGQSCIDAGCSAGGSGGADGGPDTSTGGTSGSGGTDAGAPTSKLGARCSSDSDCGQGLHCALPTGNDFDFAGPSRGYCTIACSSASDCSALFPGSLCINYGFGKLYCLRSCDPSGTSQCLDRYDEVCVPEYVSDGGVAGHVCAPACVTDNDCSGRTCELYAGLCGDTPNTGDPVGTPCDPTASTNPCAGFCVGFSQTDPTFGICTTLCNGHTSFGIIGACGSDPQQGSPQAAACTNEVVYGDGTIAGLCGQLCNCDSDCLAPDMICESWADYGAPNPAQFASQFGEQGLCEFRSQVDAGIPGLPTCSQEGGVQDGGSQDGGAQDGGVQDGGVQDGGVDAE